MNNEAAMLSALGALTAALIWCWMQRLLAWYRWNSSKRVREAAAERSEMLGAAYRIVSEYWYWLAVAGAKNVNSLEKNIELQDKLKQATGDIGLTLPRNSCITQQIQSAIEGLDRIGERIGKLDIGEENREWLRYEIESLAEKLTNILKEFSGDDTAGSDDSEDDSGAAHAREPGSGGTPSEQAAVPDQLGTLPPETPRPSDDNPSVGPRDVRKNRRRRGRDDDRRR